MKTAEVRKASSVTSFMTAERKVNCSETEPDRKPSRHAGSIQATLATDQKCSTKLSRKKTLSSKTQYHSVERNPMFLNAYKSFKMLWNPSINSQINTDDRTLIKTCHNDSNICLYMSRLQHCNQVIGFSLTPLQSFNCTEWILLAGPGLSANHPK